MGSSSTTLEHRISIFLNSVFVPTPTLLSIPSHSPPLPLRPPLPPPQLHVYLSNVGHQCKGSPPDVGHQYDGPPRDVAAEDTQSQVEPWTEEDENLSDTDSESEWNNADLGPVTQV